MAIEDVHWSRTLSAEWKTVHHELLQNVRRHPFVSQHERSVHTIIDGRKIYLPAYIPYIGPNYFRYRPRILCYGINQNLSPHVHWTEVWVARWAADMNAARDRLNCDMYEGRPMPIRPYAEGFIPLVALIASSRWSQTYGTCLPANIDEVVAVTNFVKFSTAEDASSSSIPNIWWKECSSRYVEYEILVLRPDIIIGFGHRTLTELRRVLQRGPLSAYRHELLGCRFPGRMASILTRPLSKEEFRVWHEKILPLTAKMREPRGDLYHKCKVERYPGYFTDVIARWGLTL